MSGISLAKPVPLLLPFPGRLIAKSLFAVADQALVAGSNFAVNILLARWLSTADYGSFAFVYSLLLLPAGIQQALVLEPMAVFGPSTYRMDPGRYAGALLSIHVLFSIPMVTVFLAGAAVSYVLSAPFAAALGALGIALPFILLFWLLRGVLYIQLSSGQSALSAAVYAVVLVGGVFCFKGVASAEIGLLMMGAAAIAGSGAVFLFAGRNFAGTALPVREVWRDHWAFGRWELSTALVSWIGQNAVYSVIAVVVGLAGAGVLRALQNLVLPVNHAMTALRRLFQPHCSAAFGRGELKAGVAAVNRIACTYGLAASAYLLVLSFGQSEIFRWLYAGRFSEYGYLLPWFGVWIALNAVANAYTVGIRALKAPSRLFVADLIANSIFLALSIPATVLFGLAGTVGTSVLANIALSLATFVLFQKESRLRS